MTNTETILRAAERTEFHRPLWKYHESYQAAVDELVASGALVRLSLDSFYESFPDSGEEPLNHTGLYLPERYEAKVARLAQLNARGRAERLARRQPRWDYPTARYVADGADLTDADRAMYRMP